MLDKKKKKERIKKTTNPSQQQKIQKLVHCPLGEQTRTTFLTLSFKKKSIFKQKQIKTAKQKNQTKKENYESKTKANLFLDMRLSGIDGGVEQPWQAIKLGSLNARRPHGGVLVAEEHVAAAEEIRRRRVAATHNRLKAKV